MSRGTNRSGIRYRATTVKVQRLRDAITKAVEADAPVTVRGVYYRVVSMGVVDKTLKGYNALQYQVLTMRREGLIDWDDIADDSREMSKLTSWPSLAEFAAYYARGNSYKREIWPDQDCEVIITTEKAALGGVVRSVTHRWDVQVAVTGGFGSLTALWELSQYINDSPVDEFHIYHLGDHDPSGLAIWEQIQREVHGFTAGKTVHMERLAITPEQVDELELLTLDVNRNQLSHWPDYLEEFGEWICEVDALPASYLRSLVRETIASHVDSKILARTVAATEADRAELAKFAKRVSRR